MIPRIFLLFLLLCPTACRPISAKEQDTIYGKVVSIADGDTFTMLLDNKTTIKVRLISIDCPERKQPYSAVSTKFDCGPQEINSLLGSIKRITSTVNP
jgi:endonuclease YncB( thermonuclease family)